MTSYLLLLLTAASAIRDSPERTTQPNIVLLLADDLGWSDPGCCGHPWHRTPHIDRLSREGMQFRHGYAPAPICSASRASILTGRTVARLGFEFVTKNDSGHQQMDAEQPLLTPPLTLNLPLEERTIAESLSDLGYRTAFFGKWHVNRHYQRRYLAWDPQFGPNAQGFQVAEQDFGDHPYAWGKMTPPPAREGVIPDDSMISRAVAFLKEDHTAPFFLMVSTFHVHTPVRNRCRWLVEDCDRRIPDDIGNRQKRVKYAAFVEMLDHHIGRILQAVDQSGFAENTLVIFTSDNGGHPEYCSNAPLRGSKWNLYEGGIRVPFIVRWPQQIVAGSYCDEPVIGYDLLPTCVTVAGGTPADVDGRDLSPLFRSRDHELAGTLLWHFPYYHPERNFTKVTHMTGVDDLVVSQTRPQSAIRSGDYKLIYFYEDNHVELFHLPEDISEQQDLSEDQPELALQLRRQLEGDLTTSQARLPVFRQE